MPFLEILIASLIAGLLDTVAGFGGALLLLPILIVMVGSKDAVLLTAIIPLGWNTVRIVLLHGWIARRAAVLFSIGILPGAWLGAHLLGVVDAAALRATIGYLLILFGIYYVVRLYVELPRMRSPGEWTYPIAGAVSAAIAALLGAGNGPVQTWAFAASSVGPREISATNGVLGAVTAIGRLASYGLNGMLHADIWLPGAVGLVGAVAGAAWGVRLSLRAKDSTLDMVLGVAILLAGVRMAFW